MTELQVWRFLSTTGLLQNLLVMDLWGLQCLWVVWALMEKEARIISPDQVGYSADGR